MGTVIQDCPVLPANPEKAQRTAGNLHLQTGAVVHVVGMSDPVAPEGRGGGHGSQRLGRFRDGKVPEGIRPTP